MSPVFRVKNKYFCDRYARDNKQFWSFFYIEQKYLFSTYTEIDLKSVYANQLGINVTLPLIDNVIVLKNLEEVKRFSAGFSPIIFFIVLSKQYNFGFTSFTI